MPISLDERGLIPLGVHDTTFEDVEESFGDYGKNGHRFRMCVKFKEFLAELRKVEGVQTVIIDGSFVMQRVDEPGDIDVIVLMDQSWAGRELTNFENNILGKPAGKRFGVEVKALVVDSEPARARTEFYGRVRAEWCRKFGWPADLRKGLLRITP